MKTNGHCPVWGNISVESNMSDVCSAPARAGDSFIYILFYRACAPNGAGDSFMYILFYRACAPNGAGDSFMHILFY